MRFWERVAPIVVPLLIVIAATEVLYFFKDAIHARHLVFFYLLPTAFVAMLYGSVLSMIVAIRRNLPRSVLSLRAELHHLCLRSA